MFRIFYFYSFIFILFSVSCSNSNGNTDSNNNNDIEDITDIEKDTDSDIHNSDTEDTDSDTEDIEDVTDVQDQEDSSDATEITDPGGKLSFTSGNYVITVHEGRDVISVKMPQDEYSSWTNGDGFNTSDIRNPLLQTVYDIFDDDFDIVFFVLNESNSPNGVYNQLINVSSENSGLGMNVFNHNSENPPTGSAGKLKAFILLSRRQNFKHGPVLHEVAHMWGNFAIDDAEQSMDEYGTTYHMHHWGYTGIGTNTGGVLGGFASSTLVETGGGCWNANDGIHDNFDGGSNGVNTVPYSDFELYLGGFIPENEVGTIRVFHDITTTQNGWSNGDFCADNYSDYSVNDLEALKGIRTPDYTQAQHDYNILTVILTPSELTETEWNEVREGISWFTLQQDDSDPEKYNFWEATRGSGSMTAPNLWTSLK